MPLPVIQNNEARATCAACTQRCCDNLPGEVFPEQLGDSPASVEAGIRRLLETGDYAIDWWEGDPRPGKEWDDEDGVGRAEYLRPKHRGARGYIFDGSWGGDGCVLLGPNGCTLAFEERPAGCQLLLPNPHGHCKSAGLEHGSKQEAAIRWLPYRHLLVSIGYELER